MSNVTIGTLCPIEIIFFMYFSLSDWIQMKRKSTDCCIVKKSCTVKKCNETQRTDLLVLFVCAN